MVKFEKELLEFNSFLVKFQVLEDRVQLSIDLTCSCTRDEGPSNPFDGQFSGVCHLIGVVWAVAPTAGDEVRLVLYPTMVLVMNLVFVIEESEDECWQGWIES